MPIETASELEHVATEVVVLPQADEVSTALSETTSKYQQVLAHVAAGRELAERYNGVVADVTTGAGYAQIAGIRTELREAWRYPVQKLQKEISKTLGTLQRSTNRHIDALIAEAEAHEAPFQALLDAEDDRKAKLRAEAEAKEAARKQAHAEAIAAISSMPGAAAGLSSSELEERLQAAREIIVDAESYEEFFGQAQQAKDEAIRQLTGMLVAARADEAERAELEEERRRQAAFAEQQRIQREAAEAQAAQERAAREAAEREAAELRAKLAAAEAREAAEKAERERAARERAEAIQRRIDAILTAGAPLEVRTADELQSIHRQVMGCIVTEDLFGERTGEAEAAIEKRSDEVIAACHAARAREAEEAATTLHTRRCEMLSALVGAGESALLAMRDGSADVAELERNRALIADTELTAELWGELLQQAVAARSETLRKTDEAIATTKERDRERAAAAEWRRQQEAEEAERQCQQEEADRAMRERQLRLQAAAPRLFALAKDVTTIETPDTDFVGELIERATAIVREIEGA